MKNIKGFIIIGISIIIGSLIISFTIFNKNYSVKDLSAKEHCYKKNYTVELQVLKKFKKQFQDDVKYTDEYMEAEAAIEAIYKCKLN